MTRLARKGASLIGVALAVVLIPVALRFAWLALRTAPAALVPSAELEVALIRAGLDAESLSAAGLSTQEATSVVGAFSSAMVADLKALSTADGAYSDARVTADVLQRKVRSGLASQQEIAALATAKTDLKTAEAARTAVLNGWFDDATASLSNAKVLTLTTLRANRHWKLPVEFLVKDREEAEWVAIRKALNNERICAKYEDPPDAAQQAALSTWRSDASVATAKSACDSNLASVKAAWDSAVGG